jgi:hypothetical protein
LIVLVVLGSVAVTLAVRNAIQPFSHVANALRPSSAAAPLGIHIEELKSAEDLFAVAGMKAVVLKYSGGDGEFWIEIESQGKTTKEGAFGPAHVEGGAVPAGPKETVEGYYLVVRTPSDSPGQETWRIGYERDLVAAHASDAQVSVPLVQMHAKEVSKQGQSYKQSLTKPIQLWENANTEKSESTLSSIQNPLHTGDTVCVAEIKGNQNKDGNFTEVFKIRIMCKPISEKEVPSSQQPPK